MVFVKVRETYDLNTLPNKMSLIGIHTPKADIIVKNYPGLLMQCKSYRPVSCDVRIACASMLPADPLQVSTSEGDIAPEDLFNPILYKATSNFGMSQIETRISAIATGNRSPTAAISGSTSAALQNLSSGASVDEFPIYYGLLSDTHSWKHASPQAGLTMSNLKPLVYEMVYNIGDNPTSGMNLPEIGLSSSGNTSFSSNTVVSGWRGSSKPMPWLNTPTFSSNMTGAYPGFNSDVGNVTNEPANIAGQIPAPQIMVAAVIVPPSRLHQLYYRMVVEWTIEFSGIRPLSEITNYEGLATVGNSTHYKSYDYTSTSKALGLEESDMANDTSMVSTNAEITKVM